ncbi:MAG: hypothetical protein LBB82_07860, partial [Treponema sp.]|nr:hypothetical protein [Treponema sp.]
MNTARQKFSFVFLALIFAGMFPLVSCRNPMVIYHLGEKDTEDYSVVALLVSTGEWFFSLQAAINAAPAGTLLTPEVIEIRRTVNKLHTLGAAGISLGGKHIELRPHTAQVSSVYIGRPPGVGGDLFVINPGESLTLKEPVTIGGGGTAIRVKVAEISSGIWKQGDLVMADKARIAQDAAVFLEAGGTTKASITIDGTFTGPTLHRTDLVAR